ncbi:hypothetical protein HU200_034099 [Digitaria exilis]|uniref:Uncharacterized protein n=1 Tax=Digitaria exilis TaxID=1010633 RepID=A0A835BKI9_9POAL|nr:hypothetical protein HU200_034099 [Digitaria exilis]
MLLEVAGATQQKLSYSLSSSSPRADRYPTSPVHVPVSDLWTGSNAADDVGPGRLHQDVVPEHVGHSKLAQGPMGLDSLSDQAIGDEAVAQYERTYAGPMPRKTVAALAAVTRVASGVVMVASATFAADAEVAQSINSWSGCATMHPERWNTDSGMVDWFEKSAGKGTDVAAKGTRLLAILVVWTIWCERDARIFNQQDRTVARIVEDIKEFVRLWCMAGARHLSTIVARLISE